MRRETSNWITTSLSETVKLVLDGREVSSGNAELKFQSSSVEAPFVTWFVGGELG